MYEFYEEQHRETKANDQVKENSDNIEDKKMQEALDWAEQEELKELEELKKRQAAEPQNEPDKEYSPSDAEKRWMQEQLDKQLQAMKDMYGDDLGEDITSGD